MADFKKILSDSFDSIIKPVVVLLAICIIIPFALAGTNAITEKKISELALSEQNKSMALLFPDCSFSKEQTEDFEYYTAKANGEAKGYIFTNTAKGYGGDISVMTAINSDGTIRAVKILDVSNETPGLGQNVTKESFYGQFSGMNGEVTIKKTNADNSQNELSPVTGATITSTAVKSAVNESISMFGKITASGEQEDLADEK